jgi:hypothetical protein
MRLHALILEGDAWGNIVNVSRHDSDFKMATTTSAPGHQCRI